MSRLRFVCVQPRVLFVAFAAVLMLATRVGAAPLESTEATTTAFTLENGMRWIGTPARIPGEVAVLLYVCTGTAQEEAPGAARVTAALWRNEEEALKQQGGRRLACVAVHDFAYAAATWPSSKLGEALAFAERFLKPDLTKFEAARQQVIAERNERIPRGALLFDALGRTAFTVHPYGRAAYGKSGELESLTPTAVQAHVQSHLVAGNVIVVVTGDFDAAALPALAKERLGGVAANPAPALTEKPEPEQTEQRRLSVPGMDRPVFLIGCHKTPGAGPDITVWGATGNIVTQRLQARFSDRKASVRALRCMQGPAMRAQNLFVVYGSFKADIDLGRALNDTLAEMERMAADEITDAELQEAKKALAPSPDDPAHVYETARDLADWLMMTGDWRYHFRDAERVAAITAEAVQATAREGFRAQNLTIVTTGELAPQK